MGGNHKGAQLLDKMVYKHRSWCLELDKSTQQHDGISQYESVSF